MISTAIFRGRPTFKRARTPLRYLCGSVITALVLLPAMSFAATSDFNGDGKSDILWRDANGQAYIWFMNGTQIGSQASPGSAALNWTIQGIGDFNGDGFADILWRNTTTGEVYIWEMNGSTIIGQGVVGTATLDWGIQGVGDFNGDGKADILWQNSQTGQVYIWEMNGLTIANQGPVATLAPSTGWVIQGVGDFNADGMADILWQNSQTGQIYIWEMNGTTIANLGSVATLAPSSGWVIQGVGDFNGDGFADILFQNNTSGEVYIWLMNSMTIIGQGTPGTEAPGSGWAIEGVGDFNGDGDADILWQNNQTGQTFVWLMNGVNLASDASPGSATFDWAIAPVNAYGCPGSANGNVCGILPALNGVRTNGPFPTATNVWGPMTGTANPAPSPPLSPLTWSPLAATLAQGWAAQCITEHNPALDTAGFGETIYWYESDTIPDLLTQLSGSAPVLSWASEASGFTYGPPPACNPIAPNDTCGHYTQEVWATTTAIGCAVQICTQNSPYPPLPAWAIVVCDYAPPGNYTGEDPY